MTDQSNLSVVGSRVLHFYRLLPFNVTGAPADTAAEIRRFDALSEYPPLADILNPRTRALDVGCGGGWLSNSIAYYRKATVVGIDFNPVAVQFARSVADVLGTAITFEETDLFDYFPHRLFDVVASLGVLHHTADCFAALRHLCRYTVRPGGFVFIGLYHKYGRRPFIEHFADMKTRGLSESAMLEEFSRLIGNQPLDRTHLVSWFRDQVQHPHETQHTVAEIADVVCKEGMELLATSIDGYGRVESLSALTSKERELEEIGRHALREGHYYPGFFCFLARRKV